MYLNNMKPFFHTIEYLNGYIDFNHKLEVFGLAVEWYDPVNGKDRGDIRLLSVDNPKVVDIPIPTPSKKWSSYSECPKSFMIGKYTFTRTEYHSRRYQCKELKEASSDR